MFEALKARGRLPDRISMVNQTSYDVSSWRRRCVNNFAKGKLVTASNTTDQTKESFGRHTQAARRKAADDEHPDDWGRWAGRVPRRAHSTPRS